MLVRWIFFSFVKHLTDNSLCRDGSVYVLCIVITVHSVDIVYIFVNSSSIILLSFLKCRLLPICEVRKCVSCVCCWAELVEAASSLAPQLRWRAIMAILPATRKKQ